MTVVSADEWGFAIAKCMYNAGFDNYQGGADGSYTSSGDDFSDAENVANYICDVSFEIEGQYDDWYNDAQLNYIFDYYRESLVPCLELRGLEVTGPPTRDEFLHHSYYWHPYFALSDAQSVEMAADPTVPACASGHPGSWIRIYLGSVLIATPCSTVAA